ncbi:hypothetical protein INR49_020029 [Caranx melampygus]|nr:hypothetical protein INR49_020029 [Caranx melampygus]
MKMESLFLGVFLGLLVTVRTIPVNDVTQIPTIAEDSFFREAMTEGFLVENPPQTSLTTESAKANTAADTTKQLFSAPEGSAAGEDIEGSAIDLWSRVTRHAQNSSTASPDSSTTQSPESDSTSSSVPDEAQLNVTPDHSSDSQTTDPAVSGSDIQNSHSSDTESEEGEGPDQDSATGANTETSTTPSTSTDEFTENEAPGLFEESEGSGLFEETSTAPSTPAADVTRHVVPQMFAEDEGSGSIADNSLASSTSTTDVTTPAGENEGPQLTEEPIVQTSSAADIGQAAPRQVPVVEAREDAEPHHKGHSTPDWIIIVGFIVGVAALVMLCVAIATRDKWNGPNQVSHRETKAVSSNQQRELEMDTFLHKEVPRENGKAAEYTLRRRKVKAGGTQGKAQQRLKLLYSHFHGSSSTRENSAVLPFLPMVT